MQISRPHLVFISSGFEKDKRKIIFLKDLSTENFSGLFPRVFILFPFNHFRDASNVGRNTR